MAFNSYTFILAFLPISVIGFFLIGRLDNNTISKAYLLLCSLVFYGWSNPKFLLIIIPSIAVNYLAIKLFEKGDEKVNKIILVLAIAINVSLLLYFKYQNFFISNINSIFKSDYVLKDIILPLGISFITFQQISYLVDVYHGEVIRHSLLDYSLLVFYFPHVISGPIFDSNSFIEQINESNIRKINWENVARGIVLFSIGLIKKILIADTFGVASDWGFSNVIGLDTTNAVIVMLSYTLQIYFDFSGYSDMAMGISQMINIDIPVNFNSPYKAFLITDFWKRWHMTLTHFLTKYIYIPLGGNRKGKVMTYVNTIIVFLISGIWHGAAWTFVVWGLMHGVASVICKQFKNQFERMHKALSWLITFAFVNIAWIFFRSESVSHALVLLKRIALFNFGDINPHILKAFNKTELTLIMNVIGKILSFDIMVNYPCILLILFFAVTFLIVLGCNNSVVIAKQIKLNFGTAIIAATIVFLCIVSFSSVGTFVYFNF